MSCQQPKPDPGALRLAETVAALYIINRSGKICSPSDIFYLIGSFRSEPASSLPEMPDR
jgi:hypothetical protein